MNILLMKQYIKRITLDDVKNFAYKNGIYLSDKEARSVYNYITKNYNDYFNGNINIYDILEDAKGIFSGENYYKFISLYNQYKDKI